MKFNVITTFKFDFLEPERINELVFVLEQNSLNKYIKLIYVVVDDDKTYNELSNRVNSNKINLILFSNRPTFGQLFEFNIQNEVNIILNGDIMITDQIIRSKWFFYVSKSTFVALSRFNLDGKIEKLKSGDSQDLWIIYGKLKVDFLNCLNYYPGQPGCDNRLVFDAFINGYYVINPAKSIKTIHQHSDVNRNYSSNRVPRPYGLVKPNNLLCSLINLICQKLLNRGLKFEL